MDEDRLCLCSFFSFVSLAGLRTVHAIGAAINNSKLFALGLILTQITFLLYVLHQAKKYQGKGTMCCNI